MKDDCVTVSFFFSLNLHLCIVWEEEKERNKNFLAHNGFNAISFSLPLSSWLIHLCIFLPAVQNGCYKTMPSGNMEQHKIHLCVFNKINSSRFWSKCGPSEKKKKTLQWNHRESCINWFCEFVCLPSHKSNMVLFSLV